MKFPQYSTDTKSTDINLLCIVLFQVFPKHYLVIITKKTCEQLRSSEMLEKNIQKNILFYLGDYLPEFTFE